MSLRRSARVSASAKPPQAPSPVPKVGNKMAGSAKVKKRPRTTRSSAPAQSRSSPDHTEAPKAETIKSGLHGFSTPPSALYPSLFKNRLAEPNATIAPLISPETSRVLTYSNGLAISPASKLGQTTATTGLILEEAYLHLKKMDRPEGLIAKAIDKFPCALFDEKGLSEPIDPWESLVSGIIGQQVSGAAASSIKKKFIALFNNAQSPGGDPSSNEDEIEKGNEIDDDRPQTFPRPTIVTQTPIDTLRKAGLSQRKAEYIKGLASNFASNDLTTEFLVRAPYEEILEKLTAVRGLGKWSVEMFACFALKRIDIFSTGDLGVQ
ncbi:MAG: 3-methyladenine DNA glycosylase [Trizodia sp. TS-e1964]|nr:MAG: 3-methyladenine DNA glycosylase [Trizodia sp. TS-e1964]